MVTFDPSDPRWSTNPGPLFDEIRENAPIHRNAFNCWVLSRHADCMAVLRDKRSSSDSLNIEPGKEPLDFNSENSRAARQTIQEGGVDNRPFLFRDPPDHERLRGLVQRAFTPRRVAELRPFVQTLARTAISQHLNGQPFDAVQEVAWPLPVAVICEMLDIPTSDQESFQAQSALLARGLDPDFLMNDEDRKARDEAGLYFIDYFSRLFNRRRESPGSDLLTALVQAHDGADRLTEGELLGTAILLLIAGHETTMNLISGSLLWLSRDASAWEQLVRGGVTRSAVDELLRLVAPVQLTGRTMLEDMDVGGTTLEKGSFALLLLAGANRDPDVFADPTRLDLTRDPNPQLGFGFGLHHCLGSPLARLEAEVTLEELLATGRRIEVTGPIRYRPNIVLRGLAELEIVLAS